MAMIFPSLLFAVCLCLSSINAHEVQEFKEEKMCPCKPDVPDWAKYLVDEFQKTLKLENLELKNDMSRINERISEANEDMKEGVSKANADISKIKQDISDGFSKANEDISKIKQDISETKSHVIGIGANSSLPVQGMPGYFDVFGTGKAEWRLAFRGTANIRKSVYHSYLGPSNEDTIDPSCKLLQTNPACKNHYVSTIMKNWVDIKEVAFVLYKNGRKVKHLVFKGDTQSWFDKAKLKSSSWTDLKPESVTKYFSIAGHVTKDMTRRFFIQQSYRGGCHLDFGWFIAIDRMNGHCAWEQKKSFPVFLYSIPDNYCNWTNGHFGEADVMAIFVKYQ